MWFAANMQIRDLRDLRRSRWRATMSVLQARGARRAAGTAPGTAPGLQEATS